MKAINKGFKLSWLAAASIATYAIIAVASDIFANKMLNLGGLALAGGILLVPFSFTIRDLMHKLIGFENAKRVVWTTAFINLAIAALLVLLDAMPAAVDGFDAQWHAVMGTSWRIIIASFLAQVVADLMDTYSFEWFTKLFKGKKVWARVALSNLISCPIDSILFTTVAFAGVLPANVAINSIISSTIVKFVISLIAIPIAYANEKAVKAEK